MKFLASFFLAALLCSRANPQRSNKWPHPPEAARQVSANAKPKAAGLRTGADPLELQREAKELLELSQSLQPDMESVNHGLLPKDTIEKLKRIEKLSKRLKESWGSSVPFG